MSEASRKALRESYQRLAEEYKKTKDMVSGWTPAAESRSGEAGKKAHVGLIRNIDRENKSLDEIDRNTKMRDFFRSESETPRANYWPHIKENMLEGVAGTSSNIKLHQDKVKSIRDDSVKLRREAHDASEGLRKNKEAVKEISKGAEEHSRRVSMLDSGVSSWTQQKNKARGGQQ